MKCFIGIFVVVAVVLNSVLALPARLPNDDAEVIDVPHKAESDFPDFKGVIDTGSIDPFLIPEPHPFAVSLGLFDTFDDIFRRLHTRFWPLAVVRTDDDSSEEGTGLSFNVNPQNSNTTSTVKIVDGHKIEINDTVYGDDKSVFKVRVVNIRPLDSDEDVDQETTTTAVGRGSGVTSAPNSVEDNEDSSEERREPLENKKPIDNEIKGNIDEPEIAVASEMLPTTATTAIVDEADVANLNDEFVADNTLESGSAEAETNMADEAERTTTMVTTMRSEDEDEEEEEAALAATELSTEEAVEQMEAEGNHSNSSSLLHNDSLTAEDNNEDQIEAETSDNFNESQDEADAGVLDAEELTAESSEDTDKDIDAVAAEFDTESISITQKKRDEGADEDAGDADSDGVEAEEVEDGGVTNIEFDEAKESSVKPLKFAANKMRQREDVSSSSSDVSSTDLVPVEMSDQFEAEWGDLAEANDLSNDIDIYDSVPPFDLSNDLAVNDIAASQPGFAPNPDAEFVYVGGEREGAVVEGAAIFSGASMGPKFEKLSLGGAALNRASYHQESSSLPLHSQNFK